MRCEVETSRGTPPDRKQGKGSCPIQLVSKARPITRNPLVHAGAKRTRAAPDFRALLESRSRIRGGAGGAAITDFREASLLVADSAPAWKGSSTPFLRAVEFSIHLSAGIWEAATSRWRNSESLGTWT